ncbi:MAG: prepilin-type N-terminal cleavage/methylation domain-containing protein [bacterium]|nr:prepilin-type N-terminal cleavage/methylation domain-containing protein [bacterium]
MMLKHTSERGVSMMEMMIVVVIVGLLSALAVPNFGGAIKKMKFDNTGREIVSTMRYARAAAVGQQRPLGVFYRQRCEGYDHLRRPAQPRTGYL